MTTTIHSAVCNSERTVNLTRLDRGTDERVTVKTSGGDPVEIARTEFLAAVASELDVIVIPKADLPEVTGWDDNSVRVHNVVYTIDHKGDYRADALARLAVAEHIDGLRKAEAERKAKLDTEVRRLTGTVIEAGHPSLRGVPTATIRGVIAALVTAGKVTP